MGWLKKQWKRVKEAVKDIGDDIQKEAGKVVGDVLRIGAATTSFGMSEALGVGEAIGSLSEAGVNQITGEAKRQEKEEKKALNAAEAAAKSAADADYYNKVMKARDRQVAAYMDSQTDFTTQGDALGDYGKSLGNFGDTTLGGKRKKIYY